METLITRDDCIEHIAHNYNRLQTSRAANDSLPLQQLFEQRMNEGLHSLLDIIKLEEHASLELVPVNVDVGQE